MKESQIVIEMIRSFGTVGTELTMTAFNRSSKLPVSKEEEEERGKKPE